MKLEIKNLHVEIERKEILKGVNLTVDSGRVCALMGPNGSGKSTLAQTLMGHPKYKITKGKILIDGKEINEMSPDERAKLGLFLSFQYPKAISGVTLGSFLRAAYNSVKEKNISVLDFYKLLQEKMAELQVDKSFAKRYVNEGFSGGEKKKAEILQMSVLEPEIVILDETDSGLDVDALKIVAEGINNFRNEKRSFLLITHYNRILRYITPDVVFVMQDGKIVKEGGKKLAEQIEKEGFEKG